MQLLKRCMVTYNYTNSYQMTETTQMVLQKFTPFTMVIDELKLPASDISATNIVQQILCDEKY